MGPAPSKMVWPPKVKSIEALGEVKDLNKCNYPRDVGRSIKLGKHLYYVFGDTFCFDDKKQFCGVANNTLAWIPRHDKPLESVYLSSEGKIPPFIPLLPDEEEFDKTHKKENWRFMTWSFGGMVEDEPKECGKGWMWFEKVEGHGGKIAKGYGVRVCRVSLTDGHNIKAERTEPDERIFREGEPQFGNIAVVRDDEWIYCIGSKGQENFMTRVKHGCDPTKRDNYQFWGHKGWLEDYQDLKELKSLLRCLGSGAIMKMPGHGPEGKSLMVLCNEKWPTGKVVMGWAHKMEGPWDWKPLGDIPAHWPNKTKMRYAMFPHPWCYDWNKGELLMTYSDDGQMGGAVVGVKLTFEVEAPPKKEEGEKKEGHREL